MKYFVLLIVVAATSALPSNLFFAEFQDFKETHGKEYDEAEEELYRYQVFHDSMKEIKAHNALYEAGLVSYQLGVTQFADMTQEEFLAYLSLSGPNPLLDESAENYAFFDDVEEIPESVDYRKKGAVNPVKNQAHCGSCWAFSAAAVLESMNFLRNGTLYSLSEQNLIDCSKPYGSHGCAGGTMEDAYDYIKAYGIETEEDYPYQAMESQCNFDKSKSVVTVKGYKQIPLHDEEALTKGIARVGPICVGVDASRWRLYTNGIFHFNGTYNLNHGVVVVGYGAENGERYYIVRNSWGGWWGEDGYIRVARDKGNQIGIADMAGYPEI